MHAAQRLASPFRNCPLEKHAGSSVLSHAAHRGLRSGRGFGGTAATAFSTSGEGPGAPRDTV